MFDLILYHSSMCYCSDLTIFMQWKVKKRAEWLEVMSEDVLGHSSTQREIHSGVQDMLAVNGLGRRYSHHVGEWHTVRRREALNIGGSAWRARTSTSIR